MRFFSLIVMLWCFAAPAAHAHRQPEVVITVEYVGVGPAASTQVTHRIHAHDAIQLLGTMPGVTSPDLEADENLARLGLYVQERFETGGELSMLGAEVEGNYVYFYQEGHGHQGVIGAAILADFSESWVNFVNIKAPDGTITSHLFSNVAGRSVATQHDH